MNQTVIYPECPVRRTGFIILTTGYGVSYEMARYEKQTSREFRWADKRAGLNLTPELHWK